MKQLLFIGMGGFVGSVLRYEIHVWTLRWFSAFPIGTMAVNLLGSLLMGVIVGASVKSEQAYYAFLAIGFCGGFTTFSAFALDGIRLIRAEMWSSFALYSSVSLIGGMVAVLVGMWLGNKLI